jgi:hypothetical protein
VRCTQALKRKHRLENLGLRRLPIERAADLGTCFDHIVCTGVVHHLADPAAGLRALREVLAPDGTMLLMVYAPYGRAGIYMMQEYCRRVGITATEEGLRDLVGTLEVLPAAHPLRALRDAPDFRHSVGIADALLHPQDRAFSVAQLFELLEECGLDFQRWVRQAPYSPRCGLAARVDGSARITRLPLAAQFAAVELLRGTMVRHSLIARRDDSRESSAVTFDHDGWPDYVPLRTSETISVRERLPAGAAAVLINRSHECTDLLLPVNERESGWVDAMDGQRTIGDIVPDDADREAARALFEKLWWHDQVVFDASRLHGVSS